jgi:ribonuclease BN (tRNA processing enzyme)
MELAVLGTSATWAWAGRPCSGYLVRAEGWNLLLELGSGSLSGLSAFALPGEISGVLVSHRHLDHAADLWGLFYALLMTSERRGVPLVAAPGVVEEVARNIGNHRDRFFEVFSPREPETGPFELGPFRVELAEVSHTVPTFGVRIEAGGEVLAFSADTGPCVSLEALAREADLFLCEATYLEEDRDAPPIHLRAREAGELSARAGARSLLLTHIWPGRERGRAREEAAAVFAGPVEVAEEGRVYPVGAGVFRGRAGEAGR